MGIKGNGNINVGNINSDAINGSKNQNATMIMTAIECSKRSKVPVLFFGNPGQGKTATINAWAEANGYHVETLIGSHYSQDEILGFPVNNGKDYLEILEPEWFHNIMEAKKAGKPTVLFLDELSMTPGNVQGSLLQLCFERKIRGNKSLPEDCIVLSAANYKKNLPGWTEIIAPELNRFCIINLLPGEPGGDLLSASLSVVKEFTQSLYTPKVEVPAFNDYEFDEDTVKDFMSQVQNGFTTMITKYCKAKSDSSLGRLDLRNIRYDGVFDREDSIPEVYNFLTGRTMSYYARVMKALCEMGVNSTNGMYKKFVDGLIGLGTNSWDDDSKDVYLAQMKKYQEMTYALTESLLKRFSKKKERKAAPKVEEKSESKLKLFDENSINGKINTFLSDVNDDDSNWKGSEFTKLIRQIFTEFDPANVKKSMGASLAKENGILKFRADFEAIELFADTLSKKKSSSSEWAILSPYENTINQVLSKFRYYYTASAMDIESDQI